MSERHGDELQSSLRRLANDVQAAWQAAKMAPQDERAFALWVKYAALKDEQVCLYRESEGACFAELSRVKVERDRFALELARRVEPTIRITQGFEDPDTIRFRRPVVASGMKHGIQASHDDARRMYVLSNAETAQILALFQATDVGNLRLELKGHASDALQIHIVDTKP